MNGFCLVVKLARGFSVTKGATTSSRKKYLRFGCPKGTHCKVFENGDELPSCASEAEFSQVTYLTSHSVCEPGGHNTLTGDSLCTL